MAAEARRTERRQQLRRFADEVHALKRSLEGEGGVAANRPRHLRAPPRPGVRERRVLTQLRPAPEPLDARMDSLMRRLRQYVARFTRAIRAAELARDAQRLAEAIARGVGVRADPIRRLSERLDAVSVNLQLCPPESRRIVRLPCCPPTGVSR